MWAAATAATFLLARLGAADTPATPWGPASPSWAQHVSFWDSGWYARIWREGYPSTLPVDDHGQVAQNAWAFLPGLPVVAGLLTRLAGVVGISAADLSAAGGTAGALATASAGSAGGAGGSVDTVFYACAALVSLAASAASAVLADRWLAARVGARTSLWAVALAWSAPCALVMQVAYAEALAAALTLATLLLVERRRFLAAAPLLALAALTRPVGAPMTAALALWWLVTTPSLTRLRGRLSASVGSEQVGDPTVTLADMPAARPTGTSDAAASDRGRSERVRPATWHLGRRERAQLAALTAWAALCTAAWPAAAWLATGRPNAYTATETAWRGTGLPTLLPALARSGSWVGGHLGVVLVVGVGALALAALSSRALRDLGPVAWCWCAAYTLYLAAVFDPTSSLFRLLIPLVPMVWAGTGILARAGRRALVAALAAGVVGQTLWISWVWDLGSVTIHWVP